MGELFLVLSEFSLELHEGLADSLKKVVTFLLCGQRATRHVERQRDSIQGPRGILLDKHAKKDGTRTRVHHFVQPCD